MDNVQLFDLFSIANELKEKKRTEFERSKDILSGDIRIYRNQHPGGESLSQLNERLNLIKGDRRKEQIYPLFEDFIKFMVVTEPDIIKMIKIIYSNLEEIMAFINGKSNDFVFHIGQSDTINMNPFELKMQELEELIQKREKNVNDLKVLGIEELIQKREQTIQQLN
tara:strand:+ start:8 stop:508 length:501 start_codon:yes stop_codon:yes gene_type:complete